MQSQASLSLLDMPASTPPVAARGEEQSWSDILDWSMPSAEAGASLKQVHSASALTISDAEQGYTCWE